MSSSVKRKLIFYLLVIVIIGMLSYLIGTLANTNANFTYLERNTKQNNISIKYPFFDKKYMDNIITDYIESLDNTSCDEVKYSINSINKFTSILYTKYKEEKIIGYDYFIFNQEQLVDISYIVSDESILKDKIQKYLENNKININNINESKFNYFLTKDAIKVIIESNIDGLKSFNTIDLSYDAINDILTMSYERKKETSNIATTKTTTTIPTTTKKVYDKVIAFTFDDGPSIYTLDVLNVLDEYNAKATFFEVGYMIKNRTDTVNEVLNRGYEIGNHTYDHSNLNKLSLEKVQNKIDSNNALFNEITGQNMSLLRPPYGNCKTSIRSVITVPIINWSVDSRDWESRNAEKIIEVVKRDTSDGDIVLFHDLYPETLEAIKVLVPYFYEQGYEIVSVSKLFEIKGIELELGKIYYSAKNN